ncbi:metallopeptidase family protein [bacterium]|nr:MAG: metallopeptidase family protein [bacterium]
MNNGEFEKTVREAIDLIPQKFLARLDNVVITVEDEPNEKQKKKLRMRNGIVLLGLYEGIPQSKRAFYSGALPDKITIFKKPIEEIAGENEERIKKMVKEAVWHEIAHHFGLNEQEVHEAEKRKRAQS